MTQQLSRSDRIHSSLWMYGLIALLLTLWAWAFASPVGSSPDEDFHLASIWCAPNAQTNLCADAPDPGKRLVSPALLDASCFAYNAFQSASCQDLDPDSRALVETDRGNFQSNYPPVFYWTMSLFATDNIAASVLTMRLVNSTFLVMMFGLTLRLSAKRLRIPLLLGLTVTLIPFGTFLLSSLNPSSWAIMLVPTSVIALYGSLTETTPRKRAALSTLYFVSAILSAGARGDATVFVAIGTGLALLLAWRRNSGFSRANRVALGIIASVAVAAMVLFLSSAQLNVIFNGLPGTEGATADAARSSLWGALQLLITNILNLPSLWMGSFGTWGLGWLDTPMPEGVWFSSLFAAAAFIVVAIGFASRRSLLVLGLNLITLALVPLMILQVSAAHVGQQVQPRYIMPLLVTFFVIAATIRFEWDRRAFLPVAIGLIMLIPANGTAITWNILRYTNGLNAGIALNEDSWWWGNWSPFIIAGTATLSFGLLIGILVVALRHQMRQNALRPSDAVDSAVA